MMSLLYILARDFLLHLQNEVCYSDFTCKQTTHDALQGAVHGSSVYSGESHITIHVSVVKCSKIFEEHFLGVEYLYKSNTRLISAKRSQVLSAVNHFKHERNCSSEVYPIFFKPCSEAANAQ